MVCKKGKLVTADTQNSAAHLDRLRHVYEFLQSESTLVLSTLGDDSLPHSAPLFYLVSHPLDLFWLSSADSAHSRNLRTTPAASVAVFRSTFQWQQIAGVQMRGLCSVVDENDRPGILSTYCKRFQLGSLLSLAIARSKLHRFRPNWLRYTDNHKRFGFKFELDL
jgi:uncharacterized protein YhbP (UPF0306 family)